MDEVHATPAAHLTTAAHACALARRIIQPTAAVNIIGGMLVRAPRVKRLPVCERRGGEFRGMEN